MHLQANDGKGSDGLRLSGSLFCLGALLRLGEPRSLRNDDAEGAGLDGDAGGKGADGVAFEFERGFHGGVQLDALGADIMDTGFLDMRAGELCAAEAEEHGQIDAREDGDIDEAIGRMRFREHGEFTAVVFAIADEHQLARSGVRAILRLDVMRLFRKRAKAGDDVGERADEFLGLPIDELDGAGIEASPGELREAAALTIRRRTIFHPREIDEAFFAAQDHGPGLRE